MKNADRIKLEYNRRHHVFGLVSSDRVRQRESLSDLFGELRQIVFFDRSQVTVRLLRTVFFFILQLILIFVDIFSGRLI